MYYNLMATMSSGLESVTANELKKLGYSTKVENGKVLFKGNERDIVKTNLWLRSADRIKIIINRFQAYSFDELFNNVFKSNIDYFLPLNAYFPVSCKSVKSVLHSEPDIQSITKKAIVSKISTIYHRRTKLPETGDKYNISININKNDCILALDTTGDSLFKRGYRIASGNAPIKENFAAGLILLTNWNPLCMPFYDPTTGSGTIAIEAALIAKNIAPGIFRNFSFEHFDWIDPNLLNLEKQAAYSKVNNNFCEIIGGDINPKMINIAHINAHNAGVLHDIQFKQIAIKDFYTSLKNGIIVSNPPYGKRLYDKKKVHEIYYQMGKIYRNMDTWSKYILTSDLNFEKYYGEKATKKRKLYNGSIRTDLYQYWSSK